MNNITFSSLRLAIQALESGAGTDPQKAGNMFELAQGQNQIVSGAGNGSAGESAQKGIHFGTPAQPLLQQQNNVSDSASSDASGDSKSSDPSSQLVAELLRAVMQWLQSMLSKGSDSGDNEPATKSVSSAQGGAGVQSAAVPQDAAASQSAGSQVPSSTPAVNAPDASSGGVQSVAGAASTPASGASDAIAQQIQPATSNGVSDNIAAGGRDGLHLPPALETYRADIQDAAKATGVPANVIAGMVYAESRGKNEASTTNVTGNADLGPAQVDTNTFNALKQQNPALLGNSDIHNPHDNIMAGALYLRDQSKAFGGDTGAALRAYNSGPGNVNRSNLSDTGGAGDPNYVNHVMNFARIIGSGNGQLPA